MLGGETNKQSTGLENGLMLDCAWGCLAGDESAERRRRRRGRRTERAQRRRRKGEKKCRRITTYVTSLRRLDLAAMYIYVNVNLFWFFPTSPLPTETTAAFLICPFQRVFKISIFNSKKKEREKERKKMYRIVSCRVANARVGYRIKCLSKV